MERADAILIKGPGPVYGAELPPEHRFVCLMRDMPPEVIEDIDEPGTYEVDLAILKDGVQWPALLMAIPYHHLTAFKNMTPEQVRSAIDQALAATSQ